MCRGKVERNKSEVDIEFRFLKIMGGGCEEALSRAGVPGLPGSHRPITLAVTETAT